MKRRPFILLGALVLIAALVVIGMLTSSSPLPGKRLLIHFTAGLNGELEPCGCDPAQRGGVSKRLALIAKARAGEEAALYVDGGDFLGFPPLLRGFDRPSNPSHLSEAKRRFGEIKNRAILRGFEEAGIAGLALGERDFVLGQVFLRDAAKRLPILSSNIAYANSGRLVFRSHRTVTVGRGRLFGVPWGGVKIGICSLTSPTFQLNIRKEDINALRAAPLEEAARKVLKILVEEEGCNLVLCLFHGTAAQAKELVSKVTGIDVLIAGHQWDGHGPHRFGDSGTLIAGIPEGGGLLGELTLELNEDMGVGKASFKAVPVDPKGPAHPRGEAVTQAFLSELAQADLRPDEPLTGGKAFAGSGACARCHGTEHEHWKATPHGSALATLKERGQHVNPECLQCHTTGYGQRPGFISPSETPGLTNVGCEVCHGPRQDHVKEKAEQEKDGTFSAPVKKAHMRRLHTNCMACHTSRRDPGFRENAVRRYETVKCP